MYQFSCDKVQVQQLIKNMNINEENICKQKEQEKFKVPQKCSLEQHIELARKLGLYFEMPESKQKIINQIYQQAINQSLDQSTQKKDSFMSLFKQQKFREDRIYKRHNDTNFNLLQGSAKNLRPLKKYKKKQIPRKQSISSLHTSPSKYQIPIPFISKLKNQYL